MRIMIVDDSLVFRSLLKAALSGVQGAEVVESLANGDKAVAAFERDPCDLLILDLEMPKMSGIEVLWRIRAKNQRVRVIVLAPPNRQGAAEALESLRLGAADIIEKPDGEALERRDIGEVIKQLLVPKIRQFLLTHPPTSSEPESQAVTSTPRRGERYKRVSLVGLRPKVVVIGCSTGGPKALETIFSQIHGTLSAPILMVQHMPPVFTRCLSERLAGLTGIPGGEAANGEMLMTSRLYVAPGNYHMQLGQKGDSVRLLLNQDPPLNHVRPSADPLFESAARIFGSQVLGIVLTGMGEDGARGAEAIKKAGGAVVIQTSQSCVVDGMPRAVAARKAFDAQMDLNEIATLLRQIAVDPVRRSA